MRRRDLLLGVAAAALVDATHVAGAAEPARQGAAQDATGFALLGSVRILSTDSRNAQTDVPIEFGIPLAPGDLARNERIALRAGTTNLQVQEDNRIADRGGDIRWVKVTAILPSLPAGGNVVVAFGKEPGAPASGASKTVAQLLAMNPDIEATVTTVDTGGDGTTRIAKMREAAAGSASWTKGKPRLRSGYWRDGPLCKEFICDAPQKTSDGAPDPFLFTTFHVAYYSTDNFTTIDRARIVCCTENGFVDQASPTERHLSASIGVGVSSPATKVSFQTRTPPVELSATALGKWFKLAGPPGTFSVNDQGKAVTHGADFGTCCYVPPDGSYAVFLKHTLSAPATWAGGSWKLHGLRIQFLTHWTGEKVWQGAEPKYKVLFRPDLWKRSALVMNYGFPSEALSNTRHVLTLEGAGISVVARDGNNPMALFKKYADTTKGEAERGERNIDSQDEARVIPNWQLSSLCKTDSAGYMLEEGWDRIFHTAKLWDNAITDRFIDDNTGSLVYWFNRPMWMDNLVKKPVKRGFSLIVDESHSDDMGYIPYLMTGDFNWLDDLHGRTVGRWAARHNNEGTSRNFSDGGDQRWWWQANQARGGTWCDRMLSHAAFCTPDNMPAALLAHSKSALRTWQGHIWQHAAALYTANPTGWSRESPPTGPGPNPAPDGPFFIHTSLGVTFHTWEFSYCCWVAAHLKEIGELTQDGFNFYRGFFRSKYEGMLNPLVTSQEADANTARENMTGVGHPVAFQYPGPYPGWDGLYRLLKALPRNRGYAAYEWQAAVLNKTHNFYGTPEGQDKILQYFVNYATSRNLIGRPAGFDSWDVSWRDNYLLVR